MKIKLFIYLMLFLSATVILYSKNNIFAQDISKESLAKEGLTEQDFVEIVTYYYRNPQPVKLISCFKVTLSENKFIADESSFGPFVHFIATVAHNDETVLNELKKLQIIYSGIQKRSIERIIKEARNFKSPIPRSPRDLDYLWAEFIATGEKTPVRKLINTFEKPDNNENFLLRATAESSLKSNAQMHQTVYGIIREAAATAKGKSKQILDKILKDTGSKWQKYGFVKESNLVEKIARLDQMIKDNPLDAANYLSRSIALVNNFSYDQALEDSLKALSLNPNLPIANNLVGFIYIYKGRYAEAEAYLKKATEQSPNFSKPYLNLARIYQHRNNLDKAIEQITKAIELEPNFCEAYIIRAEIYFNKQEYVQAIADLEKAIKINPSLKQQLENQIEIIQQLKP